MMKCRMTSGERQLQPPHQVLWLQQKHRICWCLSLVLVPAKAKKACISCQAVLMPEGEALFSRYALSKQPQHEQGPQALLVWPVQSWPVGLVWRAKTNQRQERALRRLQQWCMAQCLTNGTVSSLLPPFMGSLNCLVAMVSSWGSLGKACEASESTPPF